MSWVKKKLVEVCTIRPPKSEVKKLLLDDDFVSFLGMEHLGINEKFAIPNIEKKLAEVSGSYTYFAENDVLLAKITPCFENGKLGIAKNLTNNIGFGSSEFIVFRTNEELSNEWLYYFLSRYDFLKDGANNMSGAVGHKRVNKDFIENYEIPLPPLSAQKKIVAKLDAIFAEIDKATAAAEINAKNSEALFQSYLTEVFERRYENNLLTTLGNYYDVRDGTHDSPKFHEKGYPLVTSKNLKNGVISFEKIQYVSKEDYLNISQRSGVKKGDVLMAMIGTIGNPVVIETNSEFAIKNVALFKTNDTQSPHFLRYYLGSDYVIRKMEKDAKGATQKFVGLGYLRSFAINVPPLNIQLSVVKELEEYEQHAKKLSTSFFNKVNQLLNFKQSILKQAFNGELVKE